MSNRIVVFDLGGVMLRVAHTWKEALDYGHVRAGKPEDALTALSSCKGFEPYQAGRISLDAYLDDLKVYLGLGSREDALHVHQSILMEAFPGTEEVVRDLHARGVRTGCLSNTNEPHWRRMGDPSLYPAIAAIQTPVLSHEVHLDKPNAAIYRAYQRIADVDSSQVVFFDDLLVNVEGARAVGWTAHQIDPANDPARQVRTQLVELGLLG